MIRRRTATAAIVLTGALAAPGALGAGSGVPALHSRLEALAPENPAAYFLLAEEVAWEQPEERELVRTLYVLAFELQRARAAADPMTAGACLALADISVSEDERLWLRSLARAMSEGRVTWASGAPDEPPADEAMLVAEALGYYRAGEYRRALDILELAAASTLFRQRAASLPGGPDRILDELRSETQCRRCRNRRVTTAGEPEVFELCVTCGGDPGPDLADSELVEHLRVESGLLQGAGATWSAQLILDRARPLRDIDPGELAPWFGVNPNNVYFRNGRWTDVPEAPAPAPAPDPDAEPAG